jgi:hypothetical protein
MPGQFGFELPCDGVVDEPPGAVVLGVVVVGIVVVVLGVVAVLLELAALAIAAPPPARIPAVPRARRTVRSRFVAFTSTVFLRVLDARKLAEHENRVWRI